VKKQWLDSKIITTSLPDCTYCFWLIWNDRWLALSSGNHTQWLCDEFEHPQSYLSTWPNAKEKVVLPHETTPNSIRLGNWNYMYQKCWKSEAFQFPSRRVFSCLNTITFLMCNNWLNWLCYKFAVLDASSNLRMSSDATLIYTCPFSLCISICIHCTYSSANLKKYIWLVKIAHEFWPHFSIFKF